VLTKWHRRGIPWKYWPRVVSLAERADIAVTIDDLERTKPSDRSVPCQTL
jgi:hypothetical protein